MWPKATRRKPGPVRTAASSGSGQEGRCSTTTSRSRTRAFSPLRSIAHTSTTSTSMVASTLGDGATRRSSPSLCHSSYRRTSCTGSATSATATLRSSTRRPPRWALSDPVASTAQYQGPRSPTGMSTPCNRSSGASASRRAPTPTSTSCLCRGRRLRRRLGSAGTSPPPSSSPAALGLSSTLMCGFSATPCSATSSRRATTARRLPGA
mmetsp:Transcript_125961/g.362244  ORF Transcript_125961/g.362244 Transcript_125961/m.362244 type:complete len:208 (+) Transcript_125961:267-890(+)